MKQKILFDQSAREQVLEGVNLATRVVAVTLGPKGKNIIYNPLHGYLRSTKDGISVINDIVPDNPLLHTGVKMIRECSQKTANEAGDSTTTTAILASAMINEAHRLLNEGKSPVALRKGIEAATIKCVEWIKANAIPVNGDVEKIRAIATISANNNSEIGNLIAEAFSKIGEAGVITLEDSKTGKSEVEVLGGYSFDRGMISPYFINDEVKRTCEFNEPLILLYDKKITKINDLLAALEVAIKSQKPLVIIAAGCEGEALGTLVANKMQKGLQVCVVFAPEGGIKRAETMQDIAIFTGGKVISEDQGSNLDKDNFKTEFLGLAQKVIIKRDSCTIINGQGNPDEVEARQGRIKEMLAEAPSDLEKEYLRKRAGSIGKGVAVLSIGAATDIEQGDIKALAEDAILATRAAIEEGYLPGGGVGMFRCAQSLESIFSVTDIGELIVMNGLRGPIIQIFKNNEINSEKQKEYIKIIAENKDDYGYNAKTETFGNLIEEGVIDAAKVIRCAIENAASIAAQFCSTDILISEMPD